jgi:hypothetical protein
MPVQRWRRFHGANIVTEVASMEGVSALEASTWLASDPTVVMFVPRRFVDLAGAQSEADAFACKSFDHWCDISTCGEWKQWPGPRTRHDPRYNPLRPRQH